MVVAEIDFSCLPLTSSATVPNPLNPFSQALRTYVLTQLHQALKDPHVTSVVLTGGNSNNFSAGADLTELSSVSALSSLSRVSTTPSPSSSLLSSSSGPTLLDVIEVIDTSSKPIIAAITGACLGGGLEVALACQYRIAVASAKLGLPETQVGLIPGAGGTQRLPRCIGLEQSLPLILTGQSINAAKALQLGMLDAVVPTVDALLSEAHKWAQFAELTPLEPRRLSQRSVPVHPATAHVLIHTARLQLPRQGVACQVAALEALRACTLPFKEGVNVELDQFVALLSHPEGVARRHAFFAVRTAQSLVASIHPAIKTHPLLSASKALNPPNVEVAVIGAGTMGAGIALVLLQANYQVWLVDVSADALQKGLAFVQTAIDSMVKRRKVSSTMAKDWLQAPRFQTTQNLNDLQHCQLVVEAVVENLAIKRKIFADLSRICPPQALLVSNTSTLDIDALSQAVTVNPSRVAGWHFFSPAHIMKLVEIVVGTSTSMDTVTVLQLLTKQRLGGKIGVVVGNCDGFCGNRMLKPYSAETALLLVEGASIPQIDQALLEFGMALGPFQMSDLAGNDVGYYIRKERKWVRLDKNDPNPPPARPARYTELVDDMVALLGRNGQKSGKGWYDYPPSSKNRRQGLPSPEMDDLIQRHRIAYHAKDMSGDTIVERVLFPLVNEGFKCLEEGIARCPGDIDVVYLYGYGFPVWRGGPMFWADHTIGLPVLLEKLRKMSSQFPLTEHYVPSKLLEKCVELGVTVDEYYSRGMMKKLHTSRL